MSENLSFDNERNSSNSTDNENNVNEDMDIINKEEQIQGDDYILIYFLLLLNLLYSHTMNCLL